ncbi:MAG: alanine--glyoxylate aminotransferase family protein [Planctomycetota bacterium]|nr:alanine--glyoxylate aminotransferase family protein [Planctomycetota bacterium]
MPLPLSFDPPRRLLLGPGPSDCHPSVLRAMAAPLLGHLDPAFVGLMSNLQDLLRQAFQTKNTLSLAISATGMAGMECTLVNLLEPGDKAVICAAGYFGQRMVEVAGRAGAKVTTLSVPWGQVFDLNQIREVLQSVRPKVLGIVHAETSTGALQPMAELGKLCHEFDALLVMDAVTSLGCVELDVDGWEIDAVFSCSQKGLSCPPGLSPVSFSERSAEVIRNRKTPCQSWYLDLGLLMKYWGQDRFYHHTAPITMNYALFEGLRLVIEEGLQTRWQRHKLHHTALRAGLESLGFQYATQPDAILPQLNAILIPKGLEDLPVRKAMLEDYGIEIGAGLGDFRGKIWRIGLMGYNARRDVVVKVLSALGTVLKRQGHTCDIALALEASDATYPKA